MMGRISSGSVLALWHCGTPGARLTPSLPPDLARQHCRGVMTALTIVCLGRMPGGRLGTVDMIEFEGSDYAGTHLTGPPFPKNKASDGGAAC